MEEAADDGEVRLESQKLKAEVTPHSLDICSTHIPHAMFTTEANVPPKSVRASTETVVS